jgi:hypothetical protein
MLMTMAMSQSPTRLRRIATEPEELRDGDVAKDNGPVERGELAHEALFHHGHLEKIAAVKGGEGLHEVAVSDDKAGDQKNFPHVVEMAEGEKFLPV